MGLISVYYTLYRDTACACHWFGFYFHIREALLEETTVKSCKYKVSLVPRKWNECPPHVYCDNPVKIDVAAVSRERKSRRDVRIEGAAHGGTYQ